MKNRTTQLQKVYDTFYQQPLTMKEADGVSGIMRESICRYCKVLKERNQLHVAGKRLCSVTQHMATLYTSNYELLPPSRQLKLFRDGY